MSEAGLGSRTTLAARDIERRPMLDDAPLTAQQQDNHGVLSEERTNRGRNFRGRQFRRGYTRGCNRTPQDGVSNQRYRPDTEFRADDSRQGPRPRPDRGYRGRSRNAGGVQDNVRQIAVQLNDNLIIGKENDSVEQQKGHDRLQFNGNSGRVSWRARGNYRGRRPYFRPPRFDRVNDRNLPGTANLVSNEGPSTEEAAGFDGEQNSKEVISFRDKEVKQFQLRFPKAAKLDGDGDQFAFVFTPSDPDWPFDIRHIHFLMNFPEDYPKVPLSLTVINKDDIMPAALVSDIDSAIAQWIEFFHSRHAVLFRGLIRYMDGKLQEIFVESLRKIKRSKEQPQVVLVEPKRPTSTIREDTVFEVVDEELLNLRALPKKHEKLKELEELIAKGPTKSEEKPARPSPGNSQLTKILMNYDPQTAPRRGIEIKFRFVDLSESITFLVCDRLVISVHCKKCKKLAEFRLLPGKLAVVHCSKCPAALQACFRPSILFQFNTILGYLELKECSIRDVALSKCHFYLDCQHCSHLSPLEGVHLGHRSSSNCANCNLKAQLTLDSLKYLDLCALETTIKASKLNKTNKDIAIQAGKPLPQNGACKHYKKSFRWFRFPCCGQAHPCDDCHNEAENHLAEYASRMICGFCAKEQPVSNDKPCTKCSNNTIARRTAHWEGGKGCRNKLKMDTNDSKKYTGLSKTISRKSTAKTK